MQAMPTPDAATSINEIIARCAQTSTVFNRLGMDTCCGGGVSVPTRNAGRRRTIGHRRRDRSAARHVMTRRSSRNAQGRRRIT